MRIAATSMTPIQVIESFRTKLQSIGISSFMQVNFESANSKIICGSESDACLQRVSETGKRLRRVTGGAPQARRHSWRLADTQRGRSSERLRTGKKGETSERPSWAQTEGGLPEGRSQGYGRASASFQGRYGILFDRAHRPTECHICPPGVSLFVYGVTLLRNQKVNVLTSRCIKKRRRPSQTKL